MTAVLSRPSSVITGPEPLFAAIGAPSYFEPEADWAAAVAGGADVRYLILNPDSGPGAVPDQRHVRWAHEASAAGVTVLGYVSTMWGARSAEAVNADILRHREWYGVHSIFFDEAATSPALVDRYAALAEVVHAEPGAVVAMNPGTVPDPSYATVADVLVVFEGPWSIYRTTTVPSWVLDHPPSLFWHLVYETPRSALRTAVDRVRRLNAATLYITDDASPNPWDALPTYWERELAELSEAHAAACSS